MEDWQEMLIIILVVLLAVTAYFVYLGQQIAGLRDSISDYSDLKGSISEAQGTGDTSPVSSPFGIILNGLGS